MPKEKRSTSQFLSSAPTASVTTYEVKTSQNRDGQSTRMRPVAHSTTVNLSRDKKDPKSIRTPNLLTIEPNAEKIINFNVIADASKRKGKTQHDMSNDWILKQEEYMSVFLEQEVPPYVHRLCPCGSKEQAVYLCVNCHGDTTYCTQCILQQHRMIPLHRIKRWNGLFLEDTSLSKLGLVTHFGHSGYACRSASSISPLLVLHIDGFHHISASFCRCSSAETFDLQLFRSKLFPATVHSPKTVFTFEVLEQYRLHHLEGKVSAYIYVQSLYRLTDDEGSSEVKNRVREFRRISKQWSFLVACKRAGRYGLYRLSQPLVFQCPACPRPGINIPSNWREQLSITKYWLVRRFVHFDANFRLVLARRENRDPGDRSLWSGPGFFVNSDLYDKYLKAAGEVPQEKSDCVNHRAVMLTTMSRNDRLEVTGIAGGVCRHECAIPDGFVNLYKGERYVYSDFAVASILKAIGPHQQAVLSYDIACQYSRNFVARFTALPNFLCALGFGLTLGLGLGFLIPIFLIPKFHLPAHQQECHYLYSFNFTKGVGRTDGEAIERFWSLLNYLSGSTMRMTPLGRLDTLNSHFNDWNWKKMCKMGATLMQRLALGKKMKEEHKTVYEELKKGLEESKIAEYIGIENEYQPQKGIRSIYQAASEKIPTRDEILHRLSESGPQLRSPDVTDSSQSAIPFWINDGINIENLQVLLRMDARSLNKNSTENQRNEIAERRDNLIKTIAEWKTRSPSGVDPEPEDDNDEQHPEQIQLPLPSSMPVNNQDPILKSIEKDLREGQAFDLLHSLRKSLAGRVALQRNQKRDQNGQNGKTRSATVVNRVSHEITKIIKRYRHTYDALKALGATPHPQLQELKDEDASAKNVFSYTKEVGRGSNTEISWIWRQVPIGDDAHSDSWLEEVLRIQFLEAKTTYDRWDEECELVEAELSYTLGTFIYMENHWYKRALQTGPPGTIAHGHYMANLYHIMAEQIRDKISTIPKTPAPVNPQLLISL